MNRYESSSNSTTFIIHYIMFDVKEYLGLDSVSPLHSKSNEVNESQLDVINQVKGFLVEEIYFSGENKNVAFPAIFLKKVEEFNSSVLLEIRKIQRKIWNFKKVIFLYVYSDTEIRIYNCAKRPLFPSEKLKDLEIESCAFSDKEKLEQLQRFFSGIAIDTGMIWTLEEASKIRKKINLDKRVNKYLVESLIFLAKQLKEKGLNDFSLIHNIVMRSLFILYLEDRRAMHETFYSNINKGAKSYFDILKDVNATYSLFEKLERHFNGDVFALNKDEHISIKKEHLNAIRNCFMVGKDYSLGDEFLEELKNMRIFDFSIIQIELLSEIYENFLGQRDFNVKKNVGAFYTPPSLVELILNEKLPIIERKGKEKKINVKILDPACGSGIFLVDSFKRLVKRHRNINGEKLTDFNVLKKILTENIFGIDNDYESIKGAAFSLYLALVDNLDPKTIWQHKKYRLPNLINYSSDRDLSEQGHNLFCTDSIKENTEIKKIDFDLVVGNPPFGTKNLLPSIRDYNDKYGLAKEKVLPFLHKATTFLGNSENGGIALIFNSKILVNTNKGYQNFRKWLFNECYVEKIYNFSILRHSPKKDFSNQLFTSANAPISILFYRKNSPEKESNRIIYYAPKTYIKTNVIEGINIDSADVKYIPREECQKGIFKNNILKIAMWGQTMDLNLIERLNSFKKLKDFISEEQIDIGVGLKFLSHSTERHMVDKEIPDRYIKPESIQRYASDSDSFLTLIKGLSSESIKSYSKHGILVENLSTINVFSRLGAKKTYTGPHILMKTGLSNNKICASYEDEDCSFNSSVIGISHTNSKILKGLTCFINSKLVCYYLFLCSSSIGIERNRVKLKEVKELPFTLSKKDLVHLANIYDEIIGEQSKSLITTRAEKLEEKVDNYIAKCFKLSPEEKILIDDFEEFTIPLLFKKYEKVLAPTKKSDVESYANEMTQYLNDFLGNQKLYAHYTIYENILHFSPLMVIKISFKESKKEISIKSLNRIDEILRELDKKLWQKEGTNIYFRKKINYKTNNEIFIIRPNQLRYWTQSMAMEDASELILEILNDV
ncbi:MAG: N-6 DNA methylase [Flavobacteriaceae bacterium]|nr:N-6 DNA methylase [Flavobacteriaceae bacterium]